MEGLRKLEYRGYDSAGIAVYEDGDFKLRKCKGRLASLEQLIGKETLRGNTGIGHTRWATHGEPSDANAHPHLSSSGNIAVVHNGIIENYLGIKKELLERGYSFLSETDTEVLANYIDYFYDGDLAEAVKKVLRHIRGSYAFAATSKLEPNAIVCARKENPLVIGVGSGENFIASDIPVILNDTRDVYLLNDNEMAVVEKDKVSFFSAGGESIKKDIFKVDWDVSKAEKGGYEHFMLKEIHEQPKAIKDTMLERIDPDTGGIELGSFHLSKADLDQINKIFIVACGTAYHAGMIGKHAIEEMTGIPCEVNIASEFRYSCPTVGHKSLTIVISQSGETLDTLMALKEAKKRGSRTLGIINVVGSSIARESGNVIYTWAGPEIAVASTKAFTTQLIALYELALFFAALKNTRTADEIKKAKQELLKLPEIAEKVFLQQEKLKSFSQLNSGAHDIYYLGRGLDYAAALEGALKLKEISYIHADAYPAGELKHGPIALIEKGTVVIVLSTQDALREKILSNIKEVKARGAKVFAVAKEGYRDLESVADDVCYIPDVPDMFAPVAAAIPLQLLAYYIAVEKGCDVDKPRNLAKSVTVE
jgi:glucosamine--fructose-6-phosphate aminotransferase (isomerizing)